MTSEAEGGDSHLDDDNSTRVISDQRKTSAFKAHLDSFVYPSTNFLTRMSSKPSSQTMSSQQVKSNSTKNSKIKTESNLPQLRSGRKRASNTEEHEDPVSHTRVKKRKTTTKERSAADPHSPINNLVDSLRPGLMLVFIGLNPGLMTAATGQAYSHPSNLFWKLLNWSGVTPVKHHPSQTHDLMDFYSIGNTNICLRPTRSGDGLSKEELLEGAGVLEEKISKFQPEAVCIVGKSIWETIYKHKMGKNLKAADFRYGWQDEDLWLGRKIKTDGSLESLGSRTFVTTTTSGLAASMTPDQKLAIWKPLGDWVKKKRTDRIKNEDGVKNEEEAEVKEEEL